MKEQAGIMLKSGFLPQSIKTPEQAITIMLTGKEIGVPPMEALRGINVIQGKPAISPQLMLALANRTGQLTDLKIEEDEDGVTVTVRRGSRSPISATFGRAEAVQMGLSGKDNYKKQASTMYRWRAIAAALRLAFADAISGLYTADEMGATVEIDESGAERIIETTATKAETPKADQKVVEAPKKSPKTDKSLAGRREKMVDAFAELGVEEKEVLGMIQRDTIDDVTLEDLTTLAAEYKKARRVGITPAQGEIVLDSADV